MSAGVGKMRAGVGETGAGGRNEVVDIFALTALSMM